MKDHPDITLTWRYARSDEFPFVIELEGTLLPGGTRQGEKQTHRFGDDHSRTEFVLGIRAVGRLLGLRIDENHVNKTRPAPARRKCTKGYEPASRVSTDCKNCGGTPGEHR